MAIYNLYIFEVICDIMDDFFRIIRSIESLTNIVLFLIISFVYDTIVSTIWYTSHLDKFVILGLWAIGFAFNLLILFCFVRVIRLRKNIEKINYLKIISTGIFLFLVMFFSIVFGFMILTNN
jgi:hypothetical protein